ncbi:MAG: hypothetical protein Q8N17_15260, partial [Burkholderiaceae bacterium]|nr:hypothetical protein [Burkholderiaceae bacterium]
MAISPRTPNTPPSDPLAHLRKPQTDRTAPQMEQPDPSKPPYQRHAEALAHIDQQMKKLAEPADHLPLPPQIDRSYMGWGQDISDQCELNISRYLDDMLAITRQHPRSPDIQAPSWASRLDDALRKYRDLLSANPTPGCCGRDHPGSSIEINRKIQDVRRELDQIAYKEAAIVYYNTFRQGDASRTRSGQVLHAEELRSHLTALAENRARARDDIELPGTRKLTLRQLWEEPAFRAPMTDFIRQWKTQAEPQKFP